MSANKTNNKLHSVGTVFFGVALDKNFLVRFSTVFVNVSLGKCSNEVD